MDDESEVCEPTTSAVDDVSCAVFPCTVNNQLYPHKVWQPAYCSELCTSLEGHSVVPDGAPLKPKANNAKMKQVMLDDANSLPAPSVHVLGDNTRTRVVVHSADAVTHTSPSHLPGLYASSQSHHYRATRNNSLGRSFSTLLASLHFAQQTSVSKCSRLMVR
ncbi:actin [Taenia crassiceps]|uniref:Actin n=1 Tax=Taenia crassiceps TaxID=6207 RepID=A0ABR4Q167_9CEST